MLNAKSARSWNTAAHAAAIQRHTQLGYNGACSWNAATLAAGMQRRSPLECSGTRSCNTAALTAGIQRRLQLECSGTRSWDSVAHTAGIQRCSVVLQQSPGIQWRFRSWISVHAAGMQRHMQLEYSCTSSWNTSVLAAGTQRQYYSSSHLEYSGALAAGYRYSQLEYSGTCSWNAAALAAGIQLRSQLDPITQLNDCGASAGRVGLGGLELGNAGLILPDGGIPVWDK